MELNSEKTRWNFIQDLRNKEKSQTRIQSWLNSFGYKIKKPMEVANVHYRFFTLGEFIGLQQTINLPPRSAPRKFFKFRYKTTKETHVLIDSLHTNRRHGPSEIAALAIKDAKAALAEPLCYIINHFITERKFLEDLKKACVAPLTVSIFFHIYNYFSTKKKIPKTHSIIDLFLSILLRQNFLKRRSIHKSQVSLNESNYCLLVNFVKENKFQNLMLSWNRQNKQDYNSTKKCYRCVFKFFKAFWFYKPQNTVTETWS